MWRVEYTKRFLKELASLPKDVQQRAEMIVFRELNSTNPFGLGYFEKMTGYPEKCKIRLGDYRIGITMDKKTQTIICQRIAHRRAVMTGEGGFTLTPNERLQLRYYVTHGGFLLASAGCSDPNWARSFRLEMDRIFPGQKMKVIPLSHAIYRTVYNIKFVATTHDRRGAELEGLTHNGKIVVLFSRDGLNESHAKNCCCCGGDELDQAEYINVNVLAYTLLH